MKKLIISKSLLVVALTVFSVSASAQIKYRTDGKMTFGSTDPYEFYRQTVVYEFVKKDEYLAKFSKSANEEIGLLAQEVVEAVLPNVVLTDEEGKKLINLYSDYTCTDSSYSNIASRG
jgi:hypothetical protein